MRPGTAFWARPRPHRTSRAPPRSCSVGTRGSVGHRVPERAYQRSRRSRAPPARTTRSAPVACASRRSSLPSSRPSHRRRAVAGTSVTVNGSSFTGATAVTFGGVPASSFTFVSATQLKAIVPPSAPVGAIAITTPDGIGQSAAAFKPAPKLTLTTPNPAQAADALMITGSNLPAASSLKLGSLVPAARLGHARRGPHDPARHRRAHQQPHPDHPRRHLRRAQAQRAPDDHHLHPAVRPCRHPDHDRRSDLLGHEQGHLRLAHRDCHLHRRQHHPAQGDRPQRRRLRARSRSPTPAGPRPVALPSRSSPSFRASRPRAPSPAPTSPSPGSAWPAPPPSPSPAWRRPRSSPRAPPRSSPRCPRPPASGPIVVTTPEGATLPSSAFKPMPKLTLTTPNPAQAADALMLTGSNLAAASALKLGTLWSCRSTRSRPTEIAHDPARHGRAHQQPHPDHPRRHLRRA